MFFRFFLVGDGPERERLVDLAKTVGLKFSTGDSSDPDPQLHFLLWRRDIPDVLSGMDILLHTSLNEGTPVSILEAMAMGKPVVATPVGGINELIYQSEAGFTSSDPQGLKEKLIQLAAQPDIGKIMGEKGRSYIRDRVTIETQVRLLCERIERRKLA